MSATNAIKEPKNYLINFRFHAFKQTFKKSQ